MDPYTGEVPNFVGDSVGYEPFHGIVARAFEDANEGKPWVDDTWIRPGDILESPQQILVGYCTPDERDSAFYAALATFLRSCSQRDSLDIQELANLLWNDQDNPALQENDSLQNQLVGTLYAHDFALRGEENPFGQSTICSLACRFKNRDRSKFNPLDDPGIRRVVSQTLKALEEASS